MQSYPVVLTPDDNDTVLVTFPDFPEAATCGDDEDEALLNAVDALRAVIAARMDDREHIPAPSRPRKGQPVVGVSALVISKVVVYQAMRDRKVTKAELARLLGQNPRQVDRLLDVTHSSRHDQLDRALGVLGKRLDIRVRNVA
ncbi:MAG: type II toxin-antitoxin system HicB family antitoxin [Chloroflexi bacterium]|nr:type II toxin-antitoxin system HicB family antitoxin [Chloroflexota bacterium]